MVVATEDQAQRLLCDESSPSYYVYDSAVASSSKDASTQVATWPASELDEFIPVLESLATGNEEGDAKAGRLILVCIFGNGKSRPLKIKERLLHRLIKACKLPEELLVETCLSNNGQMGDFVHYDSETDLPVSHTILVKTPHSPRGELACNTTTLLTPGTATASTTLGLLFCATSDLALAILQACRRRATQLAREPLTLQTIVLEQLGREYESWRARLDEDVIRLETSTGTASWAGPRDFQSIDAIAKTLYAAHGTNLELIWLGVGAQFEDELGAALKDWTTKRRGLAARPIEYLDRDLEHALERRARILGDEVREEKRGTVLSRAEKAALEEWVAYVARAAKLRENQRRSLQRRVKSQLQVVYSLIAQRDSKINLAAARDQQRIAEATQRDSQQVKIITFITLVFLPASLLGTLLGSDIFPVEDGKTWWIFLTATISLTAVVLSTWAVYVKWRRL